MHSERLPELVAEVYGTEEKKWHNLYSLFKHNYDDQIMTDILWCSALG